MSEDIVEDRKIIGYFEAGDDFLIITRIIGYDKKKNIVFGEIVFHKNNEPLFSLDVSDAALLGNVLTQSVKEMYDDMIEGVVLVASNHQGNNLEYDDREVL